MGFFSCKKEKEEPHTKMVDGELKFKHYDYYSKVYYVGLDSEINSIIRLGCASKDYDPEKNLAEYFVTWDVPEEYKPIMIKRFREIFNENKKEEDEYDKELKRNLRLVKKK